MSLSSEKAALLCKKAISGLNPDEIVELGIQLISVGLFRMSKKDLLATVNTASTVSSWSTETYLDFYKAAQNGVIK